jgi:hypothetical protein
VDKEAGREENVPTGGASKQESSLPLHPSKYPSSPSGRQSDLLENPCNPFGRNQASERLGAGQKLNFSREENV